MTSKAGEVAGDPLVIVTGQGSGSEVREEAGVAYIRLHEPRSGHRILFRGL